MATDDATEGTGEARDSLWPRMAGLLIAFLLLCIVGVITVWAPELRNDPGPGEDDRGGPGSEAYEAARERAADDDTGRAGPAPPAPDPQPLD